MFLSCKIQNIIGKNYLERSYENRHVLNESSYGHSKYSGRKGIDLEAIKKAEEEKMDKMRQEML